MKRNFTWPAVVAAALSLKLAGCATLPDQVAQPAKPQWNPEAQLSIARLSERQGKLDSAYELYSELYQKSPKNSTIAHRLGVTASRMGNYQQSQAYFQQALALDPGNPNILADQGYALLLEERLDDAAAVLNEALRHDPNHKRAINNLAMVFGYQGHFEESLVMFRRVVGEAEANANLGYIHVQRGEGDLALQRYSRALSLDKDLKSATQALVQIADMQQRLHHQRGRKVQDSPNLPIAADEQQQIEVASAQQPVESVKQAPAKNPSQIVQVKATVDDITAPLPINADNKLDVFATPASKAVTKTSVREIPLEAPQATAAPRQPVQQQPAEVSEQPKAKPAPATAAITVDSPELQALLAELNTNDTNKLKRTIHRIGRMEEAAAPAAPAIESLLTHQNPYVQIHSALALWRIEKKPDHSIPVLISALHQQDSGVRSFAAAVLGEIGPQSADAIPSLNQALVEADGYVRLHVAEALGRYDNWTDKATELLLVCLADQDSNVRWLATYSLAEMAPQSETVVAKLTESLSDPESKVRAGAAFALGELGAAAGTAVSTLENALQDTDADVRTSAEQALSRIQG